MHKNVLLIAPDKLKAESNINYNVDDKVLGYTVKNVQNIYLEELIGTALTDRLKELVYNTATGNEDNLDANLAYKKLLDDYVQNFLTAKSMCDVLMNISFKIRNIGVSRNSDTNINYSELSDLKFLKQQYETYSNEYAERLSKYLCEHKDEFPELTADIPSYFKKPLLGKDFGNCGIWLGKEKKKDCGC